MVINFVKKIFSWKLWLLLISIIFIVIILLIIILNIKDQKSFTITKSEIYPETQDPPVLELAWDGELDPKTVSRFTPYGVWEGQFQYPEGIAYEPANEMQFYSLVETKNFLAVAPGIVTQNQLFGDYGLLTVRYGENYAITYMHIIPDPKLKPGTKIETGEVVGQMEKRENPSWGEETWWEIQVTKKINNRVFRTMPPYEYFSAAGKEKLNAISKNSKEIHSSWISKEGSYGWTIIDGCSWIKYTGGPSWWNSNRFNNNINTESEKEFIDSLNLGWKVGDNQGRVIGPKDSCY